MFKLNARAMRSTRARLMTTIVMSSLGFATGSATASNLYGGGATLPAGAFVGFNFISPFGIQIMSNNTNAGQSGASVSSTSIFGAWSISSGNSVGYCQTGSGNGKYIFDHYNGSTVLVGATGICDGTAGSGGGFGAPTSVTVDPHFVASDTPMKATEFAWFNNGGKTAMYGQPVQFPALAATIAIVYNNANVTGQLQLSRAQVCGVFNGTITNWNMLDASLPQKAIRMTYRSDRSGTTFALANYLATACPGTAASHFIVDQVFSNAVIKFPAASNALPVSGDFGLIDAVNAADGAIGYAGASNLLATHAFGQDPNVNYAKVEGFDPFTDFPATIAVPGGLTDMAITAPDAITGKAVLAPLSPAVAGCMFIVNPNTYALPPARYPIMAISYLIANNKGNGIDTNAVRGLIGSAYTRAGGTFLPQGYAFVNPGAAVTLKVRTCINS